jgi:IS1 family transposase
MNKLTIEKRTALLSCLVEGNSLRATSRMTGVAVNTVMKFLVDVGRVCSDYQDKAFRNLTCKRIQCDEIWAFVGAKKKNATPEKQEKGWGDAWTWTAIDSDTKLIPCWMVGDRSAETAWHFMNDLKGRLANRVQLTTDGYRPYLMAVTDNFGANIDFAQLQKIYGTTPSSPESRYSPAQCMGARKTLISGTPDFNHVSTSHVERANLTMRMGMRRFTRLTNGHSKKLENHECAVALHFMHYNFCRIHTTLRCTPAMQAGLTNKVWELADIADLLDVAERIAA